VTRETGPGGHGETVPVEPAVHVESFAQHCSLTWKADGLATFVEAVRGLNPVPTEATVIVDATDVAGRQQCRLSTLDPCRDTVTYVRVEPSAPWTLSWEQRTWPVISLSGTPTPPLCRSVHVATTDCRAWDETALDAVDRMTSRVR
jgi:hypothetical protein